MKFARRVFFGAGLYGILVLAPQYFLETRNGTDYPPPITHPEYYYGFVGLGLVWQICFFLIARDPVRLRPVMIAAILEKVSFGAAAIVLFLQHRLAPQMLLAGLIDLFLGALFVAAFRATPDKAAA